MSRTTHAMDRLRAADPVAGVGPITATTPTTPTTATTATTGPSRSRAPRPTSRGTRLVVSVVAVAAMAVVAFVLLPGGAVRPADARAVDSLLAAGRAAAAAVDVPLQPGQVVYSRTESVDLTQVSTVGGATATYLSAPRTSQSWIATDGALTRLETTSGEPWFPTARDRRLVLQAAQGSKPQGVPGVSDRVVVRVPAYTGTVNAPTYESARSLPTDPDALEQLIRERTAGSGEDADVEVWVTVRDMLLSPVAPPALRAALYEVAAGLPGVRYLGEETDRLGRHGVAVGLSHGDDTHARTSEVMVFDPRTGLLLQSEQRALDPVQWGLPASMRGAVVGWTVWVQAAVVDAAGVLPDGSRVDLSR